MMPSEVDNSTVGWSLLFKIAGIVATVLAALIPIQVFLFIASPPPKNVLDYFALLQSHKVLGLIDLDILLSVDHLLLRPRRPSADSPRTERPYGRLSSRSPQAFACFTMSETLTSG